MNTLNKKAAMPFQHIMKRFTGHVPNLRTLTPSQAWEHARKANPVDIDFMKTPGAIRRSALQSAALQAIANNSHIKRIPELPIDLYKNSISWTSRTPVSNKHALLRSLDGYTRGMLFGVDNDGMVDGLVLRQFVKSNPNATAADMYRKLYFDTDNLVSVDGRQLKPGQISSYLGYRDFHNAMRKTKAFREYMRLTHPKKFQFRRLFHEQPVTTLGQLAKRLLRTF